MSLRPLLTFAQEDDAVAALSDAARKAPQRAFVSQSMRPYLLAALLDAEPDRPALVVAGDDRAARDLAADLKQFLAPRPVRLYPARGVRYESHLAPPPHLVGLRIAALDALVEGSALSDGTEPADAKRACAPVVVAGAVALAEKVPDPELRPHGFTIERGGLLDLDETAAQLVACGYERVEQVQERGQFALRGDIVDIYPATEERAVRCELFDIEVERLTFFSTFTQRSLEEVERVEIAPAAELAPEHRELAEIAAADIAAQPRKKAGGENQRDASAADDRLDVAELLPVDRFGELLDLLPADALVAIAAEEELPPALRDHWDDVTTSFHDADAGHLYVDPERLQAGLDARAALRLSSISGDQPHSFRAQAAETAARSLEAAEPELEKLIRSGYRTFVPWARQGEAERAAYNLTRVRAAFLGGAPRARPGSAAADDVPELRAKTPAAEAEAPHEPGLTFAVASLREGFVAPALKLAIVPDHRLLRRRRAETRGPSTGAGALASFTDLRAGTPVVHADHGIALFTGFETKTVGGITRDYLQLEYKGGDRVFVPSDQIHKISRYVGADAGDPPLSKLGGSQWEKQKLRARRAAEALAGELINLYAERKRRAGYAFPPDSEWQVEFETAFPFRETPDQLDAIEAVRADMEEARPMDRLICGDVGYGKTEVALRAAFKAAADSKQVMFLVPTTVLAQQHHGTFAERLRDYPFRIEQVSRFRSDKEVRAALKDFEEGKVDILIGTHRLLSRDVRPKDLGLLIVDEEQRFGVKQKELLRQLRLRVDVLSLSATPIPRTLQMSLAGLRDISVIETPPEGRRPVKTYVGEYDEDLVQKAIERELDRKGQAFFLHNRVDSIEETAERVRAMCPHARVLVAHGQMEEGQLEGIMLAFLRGEADVLVCTTIVESGLDISNANTLIVERADELGLAQLYQIRGRVGRSKERAYAYLLYPSAAALTSEAGDRLATLSDYTELGSGFKIAMRDLEIRGAGNLLGDDQSGHVAAIGFELYVGMLDEAVAALAGDSAEEAPEPVRVDLPVDAFVPGDYVPYEAAKIEIHRRVAGAREIADLIVLREELEDRFGPVPEPLDNLIKLQDARIKLGRAGVRTVDFAGGKLAVSPVELDSTQVSVLRERVPEAIYESGRSTVRVRVPDEPAERFAAVVRAAEAVLEAASEPART
ncbi:MAG TPA: transcription-repair coupling factor [Thermoleophilaceae bacterium]|nr:transcription-repair coupling factor [Thermoleophilaceae bacterium]